MEPRTGKGTAMAGRETPLMRPSRSSEAAMAAPVLPALSRADACPSRTASAARTIEASFIWRTLEAGSAPISITWLAGMTGSPPVSPIRSGSPTSRTGKP